MTVDDVLESVRKCWTLRDHAEREALCNRVKDDLERKKANPKGSLWVCNCKQPHAASDGMCNWCGKPLP